MRRQLDNLPRKKVDKPKETPKENPKENPKETPKETPKENPKEVKPRVKLTLDQMHQIDEWYKITNNFARTSFLAKSNGINISPQGVKSRVANFH